MDIFPLSDGHVYCDDKLSGFNSPRYAFIWLSFRWREAVPTLGRLLADVCLFTLAPEISFATWSPGRNQPQTIFLQPPEPGWKLVYNFHRCHQFPVSCYKNFLDINGEHEFCFHCDSNSSKIGMASLVADKNRGRWNRGCTVWQLEVRMRKCKTVSWVLKIKCWSNKLYLKSIFLSCLPTCFVIFPQRFEVKILDLVQNRLALTPLFQPSLDTNNS